MPYSSPSTSRTADFLSALSVADLTVAPAILKLSAVTESTARENETSTFSLPIAFAEARTVFAIVKSIGADLTSPTLTT